MLKCIELLKLYQFTRIPFSMSAFSIQHWPC